MRIGIGYDVHRLTEGRALILGGVHIPYEKGLCGHSDADVLTHALIDALLGAAALGDIGRLFPDSDASYKDANSISLLSEVCSLVRKNGLQISNIDSTVVAESPKLSPYISDIRLSLARALGIDVGRVSVKATTEEGLGFTGLGEGISSYATCLLEGN